LVRQIRKPAGFETWILGEEDVHWNVGAFNACPSLPAPDKV